MADERTVYYANKLNQLAAQLPNNDDLHKEGYLRYQEGLDVFLSYRGHHEDLERATEHFVECGVRPYSFAGFATVMEGASYLSGGAYDMDGIAHAMTLWKRARMIQSNRFEIEYVGTRLYERMKQPEKIREILDKYKQKYNKNFWYCLAEANYWYKQDEKRGKYWFERASKAARDSKVRKLCVLNRLASEELDKPNFGDSVRLYRQVVKLDPKDPWAWHNLSYVYLEQGEIDLADECNQKALSIMDFGNARYIQNEIKQARSNPLMRKVKTGVFGVLRRLIT